MIEQVKFIYSPLGKAFEKQKKAIEDQERKTDAIINQKERPVGLINNDSNISLSKKKFNNLDDVIKPFKRINDGDMKLEEAKNEQNVFKSHYLTIVLQLHVRLHIK